MAILTIRNIDDALKARLRLCAARHGRSMEEEVRQILRQSLLNEPSPGALGTRIAQRFSGEGGVELPKVGRTLPRPSPILAQDGEQ